MCRKQDATSDVEDEKKSCALRVSLAESMAKAAYLEARLEDTTKTREKSAQISK
jgi:hypothetical protein